MKAFVDELTSCQLIMKRWLLLKHTSRPECKNYTLVMMKMAKIDTLIMIQTAEAAQISIAHIRECPSPPPPPPTPFILMGIHDLSLGNPPAPLSFLTSIPLGIYFFKSRMVGTVI